jgi:hypothetical protein
MKIARTTTARKGVYDRYTDRNDSRRDGSDRRRNRDDEQENKMVEVARFHPDDYKFSRDEETGEFVVWGNAPEGESEEGREQKTDLYDFKLDDRARTGDRHPIKSLSDLNKFNRRHYATPAQRALDNEVTVHNHIAVRSQ